MDLTRTREVVLDYLRSKSLMATDRTMREEEALLNLEPEREARTNHYHSELEMLLGVLSPTAKNVVTVAEDRTFRWRLLTFYREPAASSNINESRSCNSSVPRPPLFDMALVSEVDEVVLREHRGEGTAQERVRFHSPRSQAPVGAPPLAPVPGSRRPAPPRAPPPPPPPTHTHTCS